MKTKKTKTALTRLTRLCQTNPDNIKHLHQALSKNINTLALFAIEVAKETGNPIGDVLSECFLNSSESIDNNDIFVELSNLSVSLVDTNVIITRNILNRITADDNAHWQSIADFSAFYAQALLDQGEKETAFQYAQKASCLYQRHEFPLSLDSLNAYSTFASVLQSMEKLEATVLVQDEIITVYKSTGLHLLTENFFDYADYLSELCLSLSHLGKLKKAIYYGEKAHTLIQNIPSITQEELYSELAIKETLAVCYEKNEQLNLATNLLTGCLKVARDLYHLEKDNYVLKLIGTLKLFAEVESRRGQQQLALSYAEESLKYAKKVYQQHPDVFYEKYTESLTSLANVHILFNQLDSATSYLNNSIRVLEAHSHEAVFNIDGLTVALNSRITIYLEMLCFDEAILDAYRLLLLYRSKPDFKQYIAFAFKTIADCYLESGYLFEANRSVQSSIRRYRVLIAKEGHYLTELCFVLSTLSAIQQKVGEYELSLQTSDEVISYLEQDNAYLKQANQSLYYTIAITRLYNLIALTRYEEAFIWADHLIESGRDFFIESSKQFAELLSIYSGLLQDGNNDQQALPYAIEACDLYRTFASQATHYQFEFATCLNELCYLQSSLNNNKQALITIKESLQIYSDVNYTGKSFSYEISSDHITALLHCTGLLIEEKQKEAAVESLKLLIATQQQQMERLDEEGFENDPEFFFKLQQSKVLLKAFGCFPNRNQLLELLEIMLKNDQE